MARVVKCRTTDGQEIEFVDDIIGSGAMKDVYFAPDKSYVVAFYKTKQDFQAKDRLQMITGKYRESIFNQAGGDYWQEPLSAGRRPWSSTRGKWAWLRLPIRSTSSSSAARRTTIN